MAPPSPLDTLADAVDRLTRTVGLVGTDASVLQRVNADLLTRRLATRKVAYEETSASIDLPSGRSGRVRLLLVERGASPARTFLPGELDDIVYDIGQVMDAEMPVILPRWAFDQVMRAWLGEMQLSASMVLSIQRSVIMVKRILMVRVSKMISDPRSQMVSLREQTVRNLESEADHHRARPPFRERSLIG
jgi:hypothetical protein